MKEVARENVARVSVVYGSLLALSSIADVVFGTLRLSAVQRKREREREDRVFYIKELEMSIACLFSQYARATYRARDFASARCLGRKLSKEIKSRKDGQELEGGFLPDAS